MTVTFLYIFVTVPYITCFYKLNDFAGWNIVYPAYVICIVGILLNFMTGFVSSDGHEIFLDAALTTRHYIKGYFIIDLISSMPYAWLPIRLSPPSDPNWNPLLLIVVFLPMLKIIRLPTVRYNIQQINAICEVSHARATAIWLVILTLLIFHWSGCISHVFPHVVAYIQEKPMKDIDAYCTLTGLHDKPTWEVYLVFLHIGVSNLVGSSSVEFESFGTLDRTVRCVLVLVGKGYMIYLIVVILLLLESSAEPEFKYQRIMHQVKEYISQKKLPQHLRQKLISYYEYRYQGSFFKENVINDTLSSHLNREVALHACQRLLSTMIFRNLSSIVLDDLISLLKPLIYLEEDVIYIAGAEGDCMYFITSGTIALITVSGKEVYHLHDGDHFGETVLFHFDKRRTESVVALEVCELLRLDRRDFKRLFPAKSEFYNSLEQIARERSHRIEKLEQELRETI